MPHNEKSIRENLGMTRKMELDNSYFNHVPYVPGGRGKR